MTTEQMAAFVAGGLSPSERELGVQHLAACDRCRATIAAIARSQDAVKDAQDPEF